MKDAAILQDRQLASIDVFASAAASSTTHNVKHSAELMDEETVLFKIKNLIPPDVRREKRRLRKKFENEEMTTVEYERYVQLIEQVESTYVDYFHLITRLAQIRNTTVAEVSSHPDIQKIRRAN